MSRILVIDDNPANLKLAMFTLKTVGHAVTTAADADEAWAVVDLEAPDLILMDLQLPGTDGYTLTRRIKADPRFATVPIVALTAYAMAGDEARALEAGCVAYVTKPFDPQSLRDKVSALLSS